MNRLVLHGLLCGILLLLPAACSKRDRSDPEAAEWAGIEALANDAPTESSAAEPGSGNIPLPEDAAASAQFAGFIRRLEAMKAVQRGAGETLLTGETLVFDYQARFVRMDGSVQVVDDEGALKTDSLIGRFSASNQVEYIEARGGVTLDAGVRRAKADQAVYDYRDGTVQLEGRAEVSENGNRLSGERISFWISGHRRMVCEPNAMMLIAGREGLDVQGLPGGAGETEIRAGRIVYEEELRRVEMIDRVRLRHPAAAMNCNELRLYLKDNNEIDWIEATSEVIIQAEDRKALAERAVYVADEGKFTLEGHPMVTQDRSVLTGDRIYIWPQERGAVCENARALLHLDDETKAKLLKDLND